MKKMHVFNVSYKETKFKFIDFKCVDYFYRSADLSVGEAEQSIISELNKKKSTVLFTQYLGVRELDHNFN